MAITRTIQLFVAQPANNAVIESSTLSVTGTAEVIDTTNPAEPIDRPIDSVTISVTGLPSITRNNSQHQVPFRWSASFGIPDSGQRTVTVVATYGSQTRTERRNVTVKVDEKPPDLTVTQPLDGETVSVTGPHYTVQIAGTAKDESTISAVEYQVDGSGNFVDITKDPDSPANNDWRWDKSIENLTLGDHTIIVRARDCYNNTSTVSLSITCVDTGPPEIDIISPDFSPHTITWTEDGASVEIAGTASDPTSPVQRVDWRLDGGAWQSTTNVSGDWLNWHFTANLPAPGLHDIDVRATDGAGNTNTDAIQIDVAIPFELEDLGFAAYLEDLMTFTRRRVRTVENAAEIDQALLESAFHQPYTRLTNNDYRIVATRAVSQVRIAIEVLRSYLSNSDEFYEYCENAYRLLLANFGTSYAELRLVRAAEPETRQALADRLGIDVAGLDKLFIPPEQLTEQKLQAVFGLLDTRSDPLTLVVDQSELLTMQISHLHATWLHQDHLDINNNPIPVPTIDPDIISEKDIKSPIAGNTAYDLYVQRRQWVAEQRNLISQAQAGSGTPLEKFNRVINLVLADIDLLELESKYIEGIDIEPDLQSVHLELAAFMVLLLIRKLADSGIVLADEWEELYDILLQVEKIREFHAWALAELNANLTLEPAFFLSGQNRPELIAWRTTWRTRREWEKKLDARIKQREAVKQSHEFAINATEVVVLPQLRDRLIDTIDRHGYPDLDVADWLTQRLSISFKYSGEQKLTRLEQAVETLQDILLSLRTGRINALTRLPIGTAVPHWKLAIDNDYDEYDFDKEWIWMGSYANWRGAMFAFGYPENYLLPTLRDKGEWTPAFTELVKNIRQSWRLTPGKAEGLAATYLETLNKPEEEEGDVIPYDIELTSQLSKEQLRERRDRSRGELTPYIDPDRGGLKKTTPARLTEVYFFVPMLLALALQKNGQFRAALDWLQTIYAYELPFSERKIYFGLEAEEAVPTVFRRTYSWILNGLDVFEIAGDRANALTRFTLLSIIRCYLAYGDAEFTRETNESIPFARRLYLTALDLLDLLKVPPPVASWTFDEGEGTTVADVTGNGHTATLTGGQWVEQGWRGGAIAFNGTNQYAEVPHAPALALGDDGTDFSISFAINLQEGAAGTWRTVIRKGSPADSNQRTPGIWLRPDDNRIHFRISTTQNNNEGSNSRSAIELNTWTHVAYVKQGQSLKLYINGQFDEEATLEGGSIGFAAPLFIGDDPRSYGSNALFDNVQVFDRALSADAVIALSGIDVFPPNPVVDALQLHAELNLCKLRNGRNIAGMERVRTKPTAAELVVVDGELIPPPATPLRPTAYRYSALIERAKQLVAIAQQIEANFFAALEKRDAEAYSLLNAEHDVQLTKETVELQDLRIQEASAQIVLLELHKDRAQTQVDVYNDWINAGPNSYERAMLKNYRDLKEKRNLLAVAEAAQTVANAVVTAESAFENSKPKAMAAAAILAVAAGVRGYFATEVNAMEAKLQKNSFYANLERSKDQWRLQSALARQDIEIAAQQIFQAQLGKQIVEQERAIADMRAEQAEAVVEFLNNKFTNVELYEWMSDILSGVYSYFLQQATAMAQLALNQLAFERQERPPAFIRSDYWQAPSEAGTQTGSEETPERRGLTGSARLLQDIYQLDQYAFETNRRKIQLVEHFSLARLAPYAFQRFRESGILPFATPMSLFDQGFPGHYLRLIKRVRISIVGLIPPVQGVRATLSAAGVSRVVTGNDVYRQIEVRRPSESIAFTSPTEATGIFELQPENELLLPFETMGVDTNWELRLPRAANRFDFDTLSDVVFTIEYTALHSSDYRHQIIQEMDRSYSAEQAYSIKREFPDLWYQLHHPDTLIDPDSGDLLAGIATLRGHFSPNLDMLQIEHVVLYFVGAEQAAIEINVEDLRFKPDGAGSSISYGGATTVDGVISTRRANAGGWLPLLGESPAGEWTFVFEDTPAFRAHFSEQRITDILFVLSYSGDTPAWPE